MARLVWLGRLADLAGEAERELAVDTLLDWPGLMKRLPAALAAELDGERIRVARNGVLIPDKAGLRIGPDDEIAFLPPVSGG